MSDETKGQWPDLKMTTKDIKSIAEQSEKRLEQEREVELQNKIYNYLKTELEAIDSLDAKIRRLGEEKRVHEENIKNVKGGNLDAINRRTQALGQSPPFNSTWTYTWNWYNDNIAGFIYESPITGKRIIF